MSWTGKKCTYRNSYTRCKEGWIYEPDGEGCVQSNLCPRCAGSGEEPLIDPDMFNNKGQKGGFDD